MVDLHGVFGSSRHLGVGVSRLCFSGGQYLPVLDPGRDVPVGGRIGGDGISRLLGPCGEQGSGLLERLAMLFVISLVVQLMGVLVDLKEFLGRAGVGENLKLIAGCLACGMGLPKLSSGGVVVVRLVTEVGLVGEIVFDV